jgi:formyl-CoA transferase
VSQRTGNRQGSLSLAPYNTYPTSDGYIAIITNHDTHWQALLMAFGQTALADDPRFRTVKDRAHHMEAVDALVAAWTRPLTRQQAFDLLIKHRVPCAPVRELGEVIQDPHLHARGWLQEIDHPEFGRITVPASPLHFAGIDPAPHAASSKLGADALDQLERDGVI